MDSVVSSITELLVTEGNYRHLEIPLRLGDLEFHFDAALLGPSDYGDVVVVASVHEVAESHLLRKVRAFISLLDRHHGSSTVTLILVVRSVGLMEHAELEELCRVLYVRPSGLLRDALLPLIRLKLPDVGKKIEPALEILKQELGPIADDEFVMELLNAAMNESSDVVEQVLQKAVENAARIDGNTEGLK